MPPMTVGDLRRELEGVDDSVPLHAYGDGPLCVVDKVLDRAEPFVTLFGSYFTVETK